MYSAFKEGFDLESNQSPSDKRQGVDWKERRGWRMNALECTRHWKDIVSSPPCIHELAAYSEQESFPLAAELSRWEVERNCSRIETAVKSAIESAIERTIERLKRKEQDFPLRSWENRKLQKDWRYSYHCIWNCVWNGWPRGKDFPFWAAHSHLAISLILFVSLFITMLRQYVPIVLHFQMRSSPCLAEHFESIKCCCLFFFSYFIVPFLSCLQFY
jgi:hypothetical protein